VDAVSGRVYAGTDEGVFYNDDIGPLFRALSDGLPDRRVTSLAVEPHSGRVHAGTPAGVFDLDFASGPPPPGPCRSDPAHLCLLGGRFSVSLSARSRRTNVTTPGIASSGGDRFGYFALPELTGDASFPEVLVKMVDATGAGRGFWFFYSGLTSLPYVIQVEDMTTRQVRTYENDSADPFCGGADTSLFASDTVAPVAVSAASTKASLLPAGTAGPLRLLDGRFEVTLAASDPKRNRTASGAAIAWSDRAGYFSLPDFTGDASFPEVAVKMVDYTSVNGEFWFFFSGLTHLPYVLTVTDTVTGEVRTYQPDAPFCGGADTGAFVVSAH
jgi:hypothetical protein